MSAPASPSPTTLGPSPGTHALLVPYAALTAATGNWAESLGSGSYGAVYAGVLHGERVAVKRFRQKDSGTDSFLREVAVAALVQHPHVLRVVAMVRGPHLLRAACGANGTRGGTLWRALAQRWLREQWVGEPSAPSHACAHCLEGLCQPTRLLSNLTTRDALLEARAGASPRWAALGR